MGTAGGWFGLSSTQTESSQTCVREDHLVLVEMQIPRALPLPDSEEAGLGCGRLLSDTPWVTAASPPWQTQWAAWPV